MRLKLLRLYLDSCPKLLSLLGVLVMWVPYYIGEPERHSNLENHPPGP